MKIKKRVLKALTNVLSTIIYPPLLMMISFSGFSIYLISSI